METVSFWSKVITFLSTPSGWRATRHYVRRAQKIIYISIHALRVEGDNIIRVEYRYRVDFYPRPPGGGRRSSGLLPSGLPSKFLSTPSGWRATFRFVCNAGFSLAISIHALRVEGDRVESGSAFAHVGISIHALRVEGDLIVSYMRDDLREFLSTPSGWRATTAVCGSKTCKRKFLSTPSGWRATLPIVHSLQQNTHFYPRPPGGGRLSRMLSASGVTTDFYPRPPGGGRQASMTNT